MKLEGLSALFIGGMCLLWAPIQKRAGKKRMFWLMLSLGCFVIVFGAAELILQM
jgi:hypothetical protein